MAEPESTDQNPRGPLVLALRKALELSQRDFARACGIEREHLSNIERGQNKATSSAMREALAKGAGVTIEALNAYLSGTSKLEDLLSARAA
jgi:transcriptional regulator with XRE-family HTH domain